MTLSSTFVASSGNGYELQMGRWSRRANITYSEVRARVQNCAFDVINIDIGKINPKYPRVFGALHDGSRKRASAATRVQDGFCIAAFATIQKQLRHGPDKGRGPGW